MHDLRNGFFSVLSTAPRPPFPESFSFLSAFAPVIQTRSDWFSGERFGDFSAVVRHDRSGTGKCLRNDVLAVFAGRKRRKFKARPPSGLALNLWRLEERLSAELERKFIVEEKPGEENRPTLQHHAFVPLPFSARLEKKTGMKLYVFFNATSRPMVP
ncbi:hypothetical protein ACUUL3_12355 [Thiovibrio sp. JS02]